MNKNIASDLDKILSELNLSIGSSDFVKYVDQIIKSEDYNYLRQLQAILINDKVVYSGGSSSHKNQLRPIKIIDQGISFINLGGYASQYNKEKSKRFKSQVTFWGVIIAAVVGIISVTISILTHFDNKDDVNKRLDVIENTINKESPKPHSQ